MVDLKKQKEALDDFCIKSSKKNDFNFKNQTAKVVLVLDKSGSMCDYYFYSQKNNIQDLVTKILPIGLKFDDNNKIEVYTFGDTARKIKPISKNNYDSYINDNFNSLCISGGTNYYSVLRRIKNDYFNKLFSFIFKHSVTSPIFCLFYYRWKYQL